MHYLLQVTQKKEFIVLQLQNLANLKYCLLPCRSQNLSIREMSPGTWLPTKSPDHKPLPGCARCDSTLTPSTLTFSSSSLYRWLMPGSTMALSTWEYRTSWCRHHWRIDATWLWHKLLKEGLVDHHSVCCCLHSCIWLAYLRLACLKYWWFISLKTCLKIMALSVTLKWWRN